MTLQPYGMTIFCDDFRHEDNGKFMIIGGYTGTMNFNGKTPFTLPTFAIVFQFNIPSKFKFSKIVLEAVFESDQGDENLIKIEMATDTKDRLSKIPSKLIDDDRKMFSIFFPSIISPFIIAREGMISTRVYLDDKMFRAGSLKVNITEPAN